MRTPKIDKIIVLTTLLLTSCGLFAQNTYFNFYTDRVKMQQDLDAVLTDMEQKIKNIDPEFSFHGTQMIIEDSSAFGYYKPTTNHVYMPVWETMPEAFRNIGSTATGSKEDGEALSRLFFYGFFIPHEVGHSFQFNAKVRYDNQYDNEQDANNIAVLYWRQAGKQKELDECLRIARKAIQNMKNPIPPGEDEKQYFTEHYWEFAEDPNKYPYIMFYQIVQALEDNTLPDFDTYIKNRLSGAR